MSVPTGAVDAAQDPVPAVRVAVQSMVDPTLKVTVPPGVPEPDVDATVAP